ncbi:MAG: exosortase C-terminal domain/associated protein EpsI [Candidatus Omnitrophota bacterium]
MNRTLIRHTALFLILLAASGLSLRLFFRQVADHDVLNIEVFPYTVGEWEGKDLKIEEYDYGILETRNILSRVYVNASGEKLSLFIIYSETNRSVIHPPEVCLIGSGLTINAKNTDTVDAAGMKGFTVNKLYLQDKDLKEIVLYCYKAGNFYTDNYLLQQALFALNQFSGRHRGGATIRVSMSVRGSEKDTVTTLKRFMAETVRMMETLTAS